HEKAYTVLLTKRSRIIERNLHPSMSLADAHPERDKTCLQCHGMQDKSGTPPEVLIDGVGCESCHGPAQKWLTVHYLPGFKEMSERKKVDQLVTQPTKNLFYRAKMCAECHVGSPDRDLNHDLYGAGHPPLHFELGAYMAAMPKHWSEQEEKERYPDFEARIW